MANNGFFCVKEVQKVHIISAKMGFFILLAPKWVFCVKEVQKVHIKIVPSQFYKISYLISCTKHQLFVCPNISIHLSRER
jgi:hypothetical protein